MSNPTTPCGFIDDGYTVPFDIPEVPGVSIGLSGTYRPMTQRERQLFFVSMQPDQYQPKTNNGHGAVNTQAVVEDALNTKQCEAICTHLRSWNLVNRNGESVELTPVNVGKLYPPTLQGLLVDTICGMSGIRQTAVEIAAIAMNGKTPIAQRLEQIQSLIEKSATHDAIGDDEKN